MAKTLNPFRSLIAWTKALVLESVARELSEEASEATGYEVNPMILDATADTPAIEYAE